MSKLQLSVAVGNYDRIRPLVDGEVQIEGVDPVFMLQDPEEMCVTNVSESLRCCIEDGSRSPEIGLQELVSNRPVLLRSKGVVVSDCGKGVIKDVR